MLAGKNLLDDTNLFPLNDYKKNERGKKIWQRKTQSLNSN